MSGFSIPTPSKEAFVGNNKLIDEEVITFVAEKIEYVPFQGILIHVKDALHPKKGFPTLEAVFSINQVKSIIMESLRYLPILFLFFSKRTLLTTFNNLANKSITPHKIKEIYLCPAAYSTHLFVYTFLIKLDIPQPLALSVALNIAHIVEYDDAYRYRIQDIATEARIHDIKGSPRKELKRLLAIFSSRTTDVVHLKIQRLITPLLYLLLIPKYDEAFTSAASHIKGMKYDEADWYWVCTRGDHYNFGGFTPEHRNSLVVLPQAYRIEQ